MFRMFFFILIYIVLKNVNTKNARNPACRAGRGNLVLRHSAAFECFDARAKKMKI